MGNKDYAISTLIGLITIVLFFAACAAYIGSAAWAVGDAQKRGQGGGIVVLLLWLFGPLSAIIWLIVRPRTKLTERDPTGYSNAEDALAAASRLDTLGDWEAAAALYQGAAIRWPEHEQYIQRCLEQVREKQSLATSIEIPRSF